MIKPVNPNERTPMKLKRAEIGPSRELLETIDTVSSCGELIPQAGSSVVSRSFQSLQQRVEKRKKEPKTMSAIRTRFMASKENHLIGSALHGSSFHHKKHS